MISVNKTESFFNSAVRFGWGICVAVIMLLIAFCADMHYYAKVEYSTLSCLITGTAIVLVLYAALRMAPERISIYLPVLIGLVFFVLQVLAVRLYYFKTGWDVKTIIKGAEQAAIGETYAVYYFSRYPNNILMTYIFSLILKLSACLGMTGIRPYGMILVFQCFLCYVGGVMCFYVARKLCSSGKAALFTYGMYLLLIGLSPWFSIPYSDGTGLFLPITIMAIYCSEPKAKQMKMLKWASLGLAAYLGYKIKPTVFIVFIAIIIFELPQLFNGVKAVNLVKKLSLAACGIAAGVAVFTFVYYDFGYNTDKEARLGWPHFLMMSMNEKTMGGYSREDVEFSNSFSSNEERDEANLELAAERIAEMGPSGLAKQLCRKILSNYNDGSFAWAVEGEFFREVYEEKGPVSTFIRSFYYWDGTRFNLFRNFMHSIWLAVLVLSFFSVFAPKDRRLAVIMLVFIGYTVYGLLFEVRARYIFIFAPLMLVLATRGIQWLFGLLPKR